MQTNEHVFDQRTFQEETLQCTKCGWSGTGAEARINEDFGPAKFRQVSCPQCDEPLGKLSKDKSFGEGGNKK
ncbi:MAG TPA: hypothetical protein VFZ42_13135 [Chitinophagaceae bacterium]